MQIDQDGHLLGARQRGRRLIVARFTMQPDPSFATVWHTPEQIGLWNW